MGARTLWDAAYPCLSGRGVCFPVQYLWFSERRLRSTQRQSLVVASGGARWIHQLRRELGSGVSKGVLAGSALLISRWELRSTHMVQQCSRGGRHSSCMMRMASESEAYRDLSEEGETVSGAVGSQLR